MAFDGAFLHTLLPELDAAQGARVEKIYQPTRDELLLHLKKKGFQGKLMIVVRNGGARVGFTDVTPQNPAVPPMFCMLARKVYSSARFLCASQKGLERVLELRFETVNEMGDTVYPKIICEFLGANSNIILADELNRTSPKTQSALLEAMAESQVTVDGTVYPLAAFSFTRSALSSAATFSASSLSLDMLSISSM